MSLGTTELLIILAVVLMIFGAGKLPKVLGQLGRSFREMREAIEDPKAGVPNTKPAPSQAAQQDKTLEGR